MSDLVTHLGRRAAGTLARDYRSTVTALRYAPGSRTVAILSGGGLGYGTCLGCGSAPCMEKDDSELALLGALADFPGDPSRDVCPTRAIRWNREDATASVLAADCIGCGLCASRCPYGAIHMANEGIARVETADPDSLVFPRPAKRKHPQVKRSGQIARFDSVAASELPIAVSALDDTRMTLFVRNLLNGVGLKARTRRRGDMNMRIDAVGFSRSGRPFVAEIEMGPGVLESPRALMEDVAVLHSRYGYAVCDIDPVSVVLSLPNVRSEYYQVIRDIEGVLGLRCRTITLGVLVILLWNCAGIDGFTGELFSVVGKTIDLAKSLGLQDASIAEPYSGAFRPVK